MSANEMVDSGIPAARIANMRVTGDMRLAVDWAEGLRAGKSDEVDLAPAINSYKFYRPLRGNAALFDTAHLIDDGYAVAWGDGNVDMSADTIETLAQETMTPQVFAAFMERNKLTQGAAAALLGRSRRQIAYYLNPGPVPRVIALACHGFEALRGRDGAEKMDIRRTDADQPEGGSQARRMPVRN
jgi:hypothetical protein